MKKIISKSLVPLRRYLALIIICSLLLGILFGIVFYNSKSKTLGKDYSSFYTDVSQLAENVLNTRQLDLRKLSKHYKYDLWVEYDSYIQDYITKLDITTDVYTDFFDNVSLSALIDLTTHTKTITYTPKSPKELIDSLKVTILIDSFVFGTISFLIGFFSIEFLVFIFSFLRNKYYSID